MASPLRIEWSPAALRDLNRFAAFLHARHPGLARVISRSIQEKVRLLGDNPHLGRPLDPASVYRQVVVHAMRTAYVIQYQVGEGTVTIVRVFHGSEARD